MSRVLIHQAGMPSGILLGSLLLLACGDDPTTSASDTDLESSEVGTDSDATSGSTTKATTGDSASETSSSGLDSEGTDSASETGTTAGPVACDPEAPEVVDRGFLPLGEATLPLTVARCGEDRHYIAGAAGVTLEISVTGLLPGDDIVVETAITYPDTRQEDVPEDIYQDSLITPFDAFDTEATTRLFEPPRSGEFSVYIRSNDPELPAEYALAVNCVENCELVTTRFPIVLAHGWTGWDNIGPLEYFFQVPGHLADHGYPVFVSQVDPYNSSIVRSEQLAQQVDDTLAGWRARKVNLLGHSQGGIDSRAVVSTHGYGDRVSALITVGSPHQGTYVTDLALGLVPGGVDEALFFLFNFLGAVGADAQSDAEASFYSLSEEYMQNEFNPENPDDARVTYISYTGTTCAAEDFLVPGNDCNDLVDPLILVGYQILKPVRGKNDGLVPLESAKWRDFRGVMVADHIDEVGQVLGLTDLDFSHKQWYLERAHDLRMEHH